MNQNRNQNRRRGRGNNRGGQGGGGSQGNRIDSRARGNAPQMLEKYRKMAHDASLNGDRVLTEYYLQFADHYFRVVADSRTQRDDGRPAPKPHDRDQPFGDEYDVDEREDAPREDNREQPRPRRYEEERPAADEGPRAAEGEEAAEAAEENPFIREARPPRERSGEGSRERSAPRPRRGRPANDVPEAAEEATFDAAVLRPSIARESRVEEEAARPARSGSGRAGPVDADGDEALEAVS